MRYFQVAVLVVLAVIAVELAVIAVKLPATSAFAQDRTPVPVVIKIKVERYRLSYRVPT